MLHNIEALKKAQAVALREAEESNRIALELPVPPRTVGFSLKNVPWVSYEVDGLREALDIFKQFTPYPYVIARSQSFTIIDTEENVVEKNAKGRDAYTVETCIDGAPYFECQTGVGFSSTEMEFYAQAAGRILKVAIRIKNAPIRVHLYVMDAYSRTPANKYRKEYPALSGASIIRWGYGPDCCKGTYWFSDVGTFWASMASLGDEYAE